MSNSVINFYNNEYDEEQRLGEGCDNRHLVERRVKQAIYDRLLKDKKLILEIGAGTGVHSLYLASKGHRVTAVDLVPKHIDTIQRKAAEQGLCVDAMVGDAINLPFEDDSFQAVLLAGPIYHLHTREEKEMAIKEAKRVCRQGGMVIIDYLPLHHGFIQQCLRYPEFLENCTEEDIKNLNCKDDTFSYDTLHEIRDIIQCCGLQGSLFFGTDGITRYLREDINNFSENKLNKWIDVMFNMSASRNIIELSEHAMAVGFKM